jgi:hypothetical protein
MAKQKDNFFNLLVNISASSESSIERLSTSLQVFVKKYFDNHDYSQPENTNELVLNCIMRSEAILYTVYELEPEATTEEAKLELLYYKDLVMKTLVVITNLDFFVKALKDNNLFQDAFELREKVKTEFRMEAARLKQNLEAGDFLSQEKNKNRVFKDVKPTEYRRMSNKAPAAGNAVNPPEPAKEPPLVIPKKGPVLELPKIDLGPEPTDEELLEEMQSKQAKPFTPYADLKKKLQDKPKNQEHKTDKSGNKILRTAMGWEIPLDFLENGLYSD